MSVKISSSDLPVIDRAGEFPCLNAVSDFTYRNPTNAIHLYDYNATVRIGSKEINISPGDMTCIQSGTVYSIATDAPGKHWCIHYYDNPTDGSAAIKLPNYLHLGVNSVFYREQMQHISRLCSSHATSSNTDPIRLEARFRLKALLLALHNLSQGQTVGRRSQSNFSWEKLLSWVDENIDRSISVKDLAERANISAGTLTKKFKQSHKTTLSQYLLHRRIDKAKSLLATTTLTIYEVGRSVGISDPQYFNKQFRKVSGISPSRYRDDNQEYLSNISDELAVKEGRWQEEPTE